MTNLEKARNLVELGLPVFKVRLGSDGTKTPLSENGHLGATLDPGLVDDWFTESPNAEVGVYVGKAGLIVLDIDTKNDVDGWQSLEDAWLIPPETFGYDTVSGGRHLVYEVPRDFEGDLSPSARYRGLPGVDIRAGSSWVLWHGDAPRSRDDFAEAPHWMLDTRKSSSVVATFNGTVKEWYSTLEPGEPSAAVRKEMDRVRELFETQGNDLSHSDIVEKQHSAVRLGAEGHSGVPELLNLIEELTLNREGAHSRDPEEYQHEFQEALESGIRKHGDAIDLRKNLPEYDLTKVPSSIPDSLISGAPGVKKDVLALVRSLAEARVETLDALSIVWNSPVTKNLARDWGLTFVHGLITDAQSRVQDPEVAVPLREEPEKVQEKAATVTLLTEKERERVSEQHTFIDRYLGAVKDSMGFVKEEYSTPLAWTVLSMSVGRGVVIPKSNGLGVNLWFAVLGASGSGKSTQIRFARMILDGLLRGHDSYWGTGAGSPEGIVESLVKRDGLPSALFQDEGAAWYKDLTNKDWMRSLSNQLAEWYDGTVIAPQKRSLKELAGKVANISFNYFTISTPDDTLRVIDEEMFGTGFMARVAWVYGPPPASDVERFTSTKANLNVSGKPVQVSELTYEMSLLRKTFPADQRISVWATDPAVKRLDKAWLAMNQKGKNHPKFETIIEPSVQRLGETLWKCAALLAAYRGSDEIDMDDALIAIRHVETWFATLLRVSDEVSGAYLRDARLMADYIRKHGGEVTRSALVKSFGHLITRSRGELADRIDFLVESNQIRPVNRDGVTCYEVVD